MVLVVAMITPGKILFSIIYRDHIPFVKAFLFSGFSENNSFNHSFLLFERAVV